MSEVASGGNAGQPAGQAAPQADAKSAPVSTENLTGEQAVALAKESKETGKSIEQLLAERSGQGSKQRGPDGKFVAGQAKPQEQSNQEAIKEAAAEAKRKLKIDDQEYDEEEVFKVFKQRKAHQAAASKELNEGKMARKKAEEFITAMKNKEQLFDVLQKLGHDPRKLAEEYLVSQLKEDMMDPKDKELRDAKAKLKAIDDMERRQRESIEAKRLEEMKQKYTKEFNEQFVSALKESELPPTKAMVAEMAKYISRSAKIGFKMSPKEAAQLVKEDVQKSQLSLIGNADGETLLKLFGDDVAKKILQARGAKVKQPQFNQNIEQGQKREINAGGSGKPMSHREWREYNRKK